MKPSERRLSAGLVLALSMAGCPGDFNVEGTTFPCRGLEDCVEGYECHPSRFVCVKRGDGGGPIDSGMRTVPPDAGMMSRGLGSACGTGSPCDQGICVDGFCCENACDLECHRCDVTPGLCLPVAEGTDPDADCAAREFACEEYTYGLVGGSCYAANAGAVTGGSCNAVGRCRPLACRDRGMGLEIAKCTNLDCLVADPCPYGARITDFDELSELCRSGPAAGCTFTNGSSGCCSLLGACCPLPMCAPEGGACQ